MGSLESHFALMTKLMRMARPMVKTKNVMAPMIDPRTVRNLSHSERIVSRRVGE